MTTNLLSAIIILSVLFFGTVEVWSSSIILFLIFSLGLFWIFRKEYLHYQTTPTDKLLLSLWVCFVCYGLFQLLPLPSFILKLIAPTSFELQTFYSLDSSRSMSLSLSPYATRTELLRTVAFFTAFSVALHNFKDKSNLTAFLKMILVFGFVLAVFAIVQKATWHRGIYWFRELTVGGTPFGSFVNRNHFAGFAGMLVPLGLGITFLQKTREKRILFGFITTIISVSVFFSLSRGGIVGFFSGITLFSVLMLQSRGQAKKIWIVGLFLIVLASYLMYLGIDPLIERFYKTDVTGEERLVVWAATWTAFADFWFTGSGMGTFMNIFPLYSPPSVQSIYQHAHNDYLEFILENGLIGSLLLTGFAVVLGYSALKASTNKTMDILRISALSSVFTMTVHSVFDFNLHILSNALLFSVILGMLASFSGTRETKEMQRKTALRGKGNGSDSEEEWQKDVLAHVNKP